MRVVAAYKGSMERGSVLTEVMWQFGLLLRGNWTALRYAGQIVDLFFVFCFFFYLWYLICSAHRGDELRLINSSHDSVSNWRIIISLPERCPQLKPLTTVSTGHKGLNEYSCDFTPSLTKGSRNSVFILHIVSCNCWIEVQDQPCFLWKSQ